MPSLWLTGTASLTLCSVRNGIPFRYSSRQLKFYNSSSLRFIGSMPRRCRFSTPLKGFYEWTGMVDQLENVKKCVCFAESSSNSLRQLEDLDSSPALSGRGFLLSTLPEVAAGAVLTVMVFAVALVWRNRHSGFVALPFQSSQVYLLNDQCATIIEIQPLNMTVSTLAGFAPAPYHTKERHMRFFQTILSTHNPVPSLQRDFQGPQMMLINPRRQASSRSLFLASTTLSADEASKRTEDKSSSEGIERSEFLEWINKVKADAVHQGVSQRTLDWALENVTVSEEAVTKRKTMPEMKLTLDAYLKRWKFFAVFDPNFEFHLLLLYTSHIFVFGLANEIRISTGAARLKQNLILLTEISQKYGIPSQFLVSIWGIETSYGTYMGEFDIVQSLATMGFTEELTSRKAYFRGELIEALVMLQENTAEKGTGPEGNKRLRGSWAGAMGQCQFMPTSFRKYAVDYDGDGRKDIWESKADVFASIGNYLKEHGWKEGGPIFQKVQVPKKLDKKLLGLGVLKTVADWEHLHGVHLDPGSAPLAPNEMANLLMPNGSGGEAYLVCNNFRVILRYNASDLYGFAVCELARLIQERTTNPYPTPPL